MYNKNINTKEETEMPELLAPAGNFEKLRSALLYGADSVYFAGDEFGMRAAAENFSRFTIKDAVDYCHSLSKKAYVAVNTFPTENEYGGLAEYLKILRDADPDALIVADPGVFDLAKELVPKAALHISTQMSTVSSEACKFWFKQGAKRVVLARELKLEDISRIRKSIPREMEIETFVHGSMCISYSGRCLLSEYFTGRNANNGRCTQPCRWNFEFAHVAEEKRREDILSVEQFPEGTFFFSSKDLCMIEHIPKLIEAGIDSFKIEGRMKSAYYAAVTSNAYRIAIDSYLKSPSSYRFDPALLHELESVSHREYGTGFFFDSPSDDPKTTHFTGYSREKAYLAIVESYDEQSSLAYIEQRNKLSVGDSAELISPGNTGRPFVIEKLFNEDMEPIESAPHPKMKAYVKIPLKCSKGDIIRS